MEKAELSRRLTPLIKAEAIRKALDDSASIRSTLVDRIDIGKVYAIRLKHMQEGSSQHTETANAVRTLIDSLESVSDARVRLSSFNSGGKYYALFTDSDIHRLLGLLESSSPASTNVPR
jgi:hypothetical protein